MHGQTYIKFRVFFVISFSVLVMPNNSMLHILTSEDEITSSFWNVEIYLASGLGSHSLRTEDTRDTIITNPGESDMLWRVNGEMHTLIKYGITSLENISLIWFRGDKIGGLNRFNSTHTYTHTHTHNYLVVLRTDTVANYKQILLLERCCGASSVM